MSPEAKCASSTLGYRRHEKIVDSAAAAAPLEKVDSITIYGDNGAEKIVKDVTKVSSQIVSGLADAGIDLMSIIQQAISK